MTAAGTPRPETMIGVENIRVGYDKRVVADELSLDIPEGSFTVIIGPNACGKSTVLRAMTRLLAPSRGRIVLEGQDIAKLRTKDVAKRLGLLPQTSIAPDGITVADLVARGRYPHQGMLDRWSKADEAAVVGALAATRVTELSGRLVDELSGGQRQRVWVAMVLAQQTPLLLLDEPTTFLDIAHQYELLELCRDLNENKDRTLVVVLHDLNQAARFADNLVVMRDGVIVASGAPSQVLTEELVEHVFDLPCRIIADPVTGSPLVVPLQRKGSSQRHVPAPSRVEHLSTSDERPRVLSR